MTNPLKCDGAIRAAWKAAGGTFYGPHVEHANMEEAKWLPFMRSLFGLLEHAECAIRETASTSSTGVSVALEVADEIKALLSK
jgi:hypothetical protein